MIFWPKVVEERNSSFNGKVQVRQFLGQYSLVVNNLTQSGGMVKDIWWQALKAVKHQAVNRVLILGVGGGTVVGLVTELWPEAQIVGVEIDPVMITLGKKYLHLDTKQVKIIEADAEKWLSQDKDKFDLVIVDLYRGRRVMGVDKAKFLKQLRQRLARGGIAIVNLLQIKETRDQNKKLIDKLKLIFTHAQEVKTPANRLLLVQ